MMLSRVVDGYSGGRKRYFAYSAVAVALTASSAFGQTPLGAPGRGPTRKQTIGSKL